MSKQKISVASYLTQQLALCGKSQREVAADVGYPNPNIITMLKNGATRVPINKVALLAKSLGVDQTFMLRLVMSEYMPETWEVIEQVVGTDNILSEQDLAVVKLVKEVAGDTPFDLSIADNRAAMTAAIKIIVARDQERGNAAIRRIEALPKNKRDK